MAAEEAVFTAAVARDEVRKSLARMEYHMNRGPKGLLGVEREQKYLDALGRQAARLGAGTTGGINVSAKPGLGTRARAALIAGRNGNGAAAGRFKSSLLAEFSQDTMSGAREWTYDGEQQWVWVANASACPACLENHGKRHKGPFVPMHPSCLCFPQDPTEAAAGGVRTLTSREITGTLEDSNNPAFAKVGSAIRNGRKTINDAAADATRRSARGLTRWAKTLDDQAQRAAGGPPAPVAAEPVAPAPQEPEAVIKAMEDVTPAAVKEATEEVTFETLELRAGSKVTYKAKRHQAVLDQVEEGFNRLVDHANFRAKLAEAFARLDEVNTFSKATNSTAGRFKWWGRAGNSSKRAMEFNMRTIDEAAVDAYNRAMDVANAAAKKVLDDWNANRITRAQYDLERARIRRELVPDKKALYRDSTVDDIVDTLVHEGFHSVDEASGFAWGRKAAEEIRDEVRAIAKSTSDPNGPAFTYAAEFRLQQHTGVETAAEMVRMYFSGTAKQATSKGIAPISAQEWRQAYPRLAAWVEEVLEAL